MIFLPYTLEQVEEKRRQIKRAEKQERQIQKGSIWINDVLNNKNGSSIPTDRDVINILKSP